MFAASKTASVSGGYQISRSLRFNEADTAYLNRTPATTTNRRTWTWSGWVKRGVLGGNDPLFTAYGGSASTGTYIIFNPSADAPQDGLQVAMYTGSHALLLRTSAVFRDPSAWYHIVVAMDTTQATSSDRVKIYVNGVQITSFNTATYPSQNLDTDVNTTREHAIGRFPTFSQNYDGLMTETYLIDGQALTPSSFGETNAQTGVWTPKAYSGSYGTNGFYLNFSDNSNTTAATLGKDYSGNGNNWTPNNFSVTAGAGNDSLVDSPTSYGTDTGVGGTVRGNYCTLNPLSNTAGTWSNGNLQFVGPNNNRRSNSTIAVSTGQWYWEVTLGNAPATKSNSSDYNSFGFGLSTVFGSTTSPSVQTDALTLSDNAYYKNFSGASTDSGTTFASGDVLSIAVDLDANTFTFRKNNSSLVTGTIGGTAGRELTPIIISYSGDFGLMLANFGQRPFAYTAPSGFKALCTQNLPTPTIGATTATQATKYFNPATYTGNGSTNSITTVGFQPDWTWLKNRSVPATAGNHFATDAVRGAGIGIYPNLTDAEANNTTLFTGFTSTGFNVAGTNSSINENGVTYVSWNWKANGAGSTNTAGSITSTVSASTTSGFSVVTYTGNSTVIAANGTVGHGLGVVPSMIIIKRRDNTGFWYVATKDGGTATAPTYSLFTRGSSGLNQTGAAFTTGQSYASSGYITSSIFNLYWLNAAVSAGDAYDINFLSATYVAYCFAEVAGYSAFGSYTGNGSADGPFVFTGFRPRFVMVKQTNAAGNWLIWDTSRSTYNQMQDYLSPNNSSAELNNVLVSIDALSNGFKCRTSDNDINGSGDTYIYAAFAETPTKFSLAR